RMFCVDDAPDGLFALSIIWIILILAIFLILSLYYVVVILKAIKYVDEKKNITIKELYIEALEGFSGYLIVKGYCILKVSLKLLMLVVPGIITLVQYGFASLAYVIDGKQKGEALESSRDIIRNCWVQYLDYSLSCLGIFLFLLIPFVVSFDIFIQAAVMKNIVWLARIVDLIESCFVLVAAIYLVVFYYHLYKELKERYILKNK
ncbi:MAG: hypothetical protein KJ736_01605, partial [Candidatus Omnitrophica bacterium]|nr:hypothetical protein [Candidatus Omnitrophota bacterium]